MENNSNINQNSTFFIEFRRDFFQKDDTIFRQTEYVMEVLSVPKRKWYQVFFQYLSLGIYKAPYTYEVCLVKDEDILKER